MSAVSATQQQAAAIAAQQQQAPQGSSAGSSALPIQDQLTLLQFRYTAALEKLVHANDQVAKLAEDKANLIAERSDLQIRVNQLLAGGGGHQLQQQQQQQVVQSHDGSQHHHQHHQQPQQGDFQLDPALALPTSYGVPGPSSQGAYATGGGGFGAVQPHQTTHGHRQIIYVPQPPPGPTQQQLEAARQKYNVHWDPFEGLTDDELRQIRDLTPNWDAKYLTRKVRATRRSCANETPRC
jgi:hypothetical protein